jgi:hypothetical protein
MRLLKCSERREQPTGIKAHFPLYYPNQFTQTTEGVGVKWRTGEECGSTVDEVNLYLETWLLNAIKEYDFISTEVVLKNPNNKWRAVSALQKAIRRGNTFVATRMAEGLHQLDPDYVWRRLCTIAIEDIGVANVNLVAAVMWVAGKKVWRKNNGGDLKILSMLVWLLTVSIKDRHSCDLLVWADLAPELQEQRDEFMEMAAAEQWDTLVKMFCDPDENLAIRMIAAWAIAGTKAFPGARFPEKIQGAGIKGLVELVIGQFKVPVVIPLTMRWAASKQYEGMPMAYPLIYEMVSKHHLVLLTSGMTVNHDVKTEGDDLTQLPMIGNYPSEAIDMHCQEGKRAISYFMKACEPMRDFVNSFIHPDDQEYKKKVIDAVGTLIFRVEGHQVHPRLQYEGQKELLELAEYAHLRGNGIPGDVCDYGMALLRANMDVLHHARCKILDVFPPGEVPKTPKSVSIPLPTQDVQNTLKSAPVFDQIQDMIMSTLREAFAGSFSTPSDLPLESGWEVEAEYDTLSQCFCVMLKHPQEDWAAAITITEPELEGLPNMVNMLLKQITKDVIHIIYKQEYD